MPRWPGGGRRSLLEQVATSWAARPLRDLDLTAAEFEVVMEFLRDSPYGHAYDLASRRHCGGSTISREVWSRCLLRRPASGTCS